MECHIGRDRGFSEGKTKVDFLNRKGGNLEGKGGAQHRKKPRSIRGVLFRVSGLRG